MLLFALLLIFIYFFGGVVHVRVCARVQKQILEPAIQGTVNVLKAAKDAGVERVVATSSISAIIPSPSWPADKIKGEDCWTDLDYCKEKGVSEFEVFIFLKNIFLILQNPNGNIYQLLSHKGMEFSKVLIYNYYKGDISFLVYIFFRFFIFYFLLTTLIKLIVP